MDFSLEKLNDLQYLIFPCVIYISRLVYHVQKLYILRTSLFLIDGGGLCTMVMIFVSVKFSQALLVQAA